MFYTGKISLSSVTPIIMFLLMTLSTNCLPAQTASETALPTDKINVFAVVSKDIEAAFAETAETLMKEESIEAFPLKGYQPHCTLYMTMYPVGMQDQISEKIAEIASTTSEFSVQSIGLEVTSGNWFFMNLDTNPDLQGLADKLVEILAPLRAPSDYVPEWAKNIPKKVEYITKYGSPNVYAEFNPHLTLLANSDKEKLDRFLAKHANSSFGQAVSGKIVAIGLGIADSDGQMKTPIKVFPLQPTK